MSFLFNTYTAELKDQHSGEWESLPGATVPAKACVCVWGGGGGGGDKEKNIGPKGPQKKSGPAVMCMSTSLA